MSQVFDVDKLYANAAFASRARALLGSDNGSNVRRLLEEREYLLDLLERFLDCDLCDYLNGHCQIHEHPTLDPGEVCPQDELRSLLVVNGRIE